MLVLMIFILLFAIGGVHNAYLGDYSEALGGAGFALFLLVVYIFFKFENKKSKEFLQWISENKKQINNYGSTYENGYVIDSSTELIQYYACISLLAFTVKLPSRYFIKETLSSNMALLIYTLTTILLGWWGLPWGPIYTVQVIINNVTRRNRLEVSKLIE